MTHFFLLFSNLFVSENNNSLAGIKLKDVRYEKCSMEHMRASLNSQQMLSILLVMIFRDEI